MTKATSPTVSPISPISIQVGKTFQKYLVDCYRTYSCSSCRAHLASHDELISKSFQGNNGRAYLFNTNVNVGFGPLEDRMFITGLHSVKNTHCLSCGAGVGWYYHQCYEAREKYKEKKFIIEVENMIKENSWDVLEDEKLIKNYKQRAIC